MLTSFTPKPPCQPDDLRAGNLDALGCYVFRYLKVLSRYAQYYTRNSHIAEDLATNALEKLWENRAKMETHRCVHRFLHRQIYQEVCNWMRQRIMEMENPDATP